MTLGRWILVLSVLQLGCMLLLGHNAMFWEKQAHKLEAEVAQLGDVNKQCHDGWMKAMVGQ